MAGVSTGASAAQPASNKVMMIAAAARMNNPYPESAAGCCIPTVAE
jgi:hypothetical protein